MVLGEVKRTFNPEFINRVDELIVFEALSDDDLRRILVLLVDQVNANLVDRRMQVRLTPGGPRLDHRDDLQGPVVRRPPAAPGHSALHRGPAGRGAHSRPAAGTAKSRSIWTAAGWPTGRRRSPPSRSEPASRFPATSESGRIDGFGDRRRAGVPRRRPGGARSTGVSTMRRLLTLLGFCVMASAGVRRSRARRRRRRRPPSRPSSMPPPGSGPVIRFIQLRFHPVDESLIDPQTYLYYIQTQPSRSSRRRLGALRRAGRSKAARRLPAAVGHQLPRQPVDRGARRAVRERRHRQARRLQHGRAAAREDRRLHRVEQGRAHEDRREDEGAGRGAAPRLVPRRGRHAPRQGHHPGADEREGLPVRRDHLEGRGAAGRPQAREGGLRRRRRDRRSASARSTSKATRRSATARFAAR